MKIPDFELERWQSIWEHRVELNVAESGVLPMTPRELIGGDAPLEDLADRPLGYPQTNGSEALRAAVASLYRGAGPASVLITHGCAEANFLVSWALLEPGDEVVFLQPNYMQIAGIARGLGVEVKPWWLLEDLGWSPDLEELERLVTPRTRLIGLCNPNNPTGAVLSDETLGGIIRVAEGVGAWILSDEVYRGAELDGPMTPSLFGRSERVVCTGGLSKAYGLPGLRTGWVVGPDQLVDRVWSCHDYTTIAPSTINQALATMALEPRRREVILRRTRGILQSNYPLARAWVERHANVLRHRPPAAGAIVWVGLADDRDSAALAHEARRAGSVLVVPGEQFEMERFLRIGFGGDAGELERALGRLDDLLAR